MATPNPKEIARVKAMGFLHNRGTDTFSARAVGKNGTMSAEQLAMLAKCAEKYGNGRVCFTSRLTVEMPGVHLEDVENIRRDVESVGLIIGGTGAKIRPLTACKGTTCVYGNADTQGICADLYDTFFTGWADVALPHKFKIAVGGCPNNCVKPDLNDLGIIGQRVPMVNFSKCRGCKNCQVENNCPIKIAKVVDGKIQIDPTACNNCGRCKGRCPFGALEEYQNGFKIYIGGRWGKKVAHGIPLTKVFTSEEEVMDVVEKAILLFRDEGISGERFADTVNRLGFDYVNDKLINGSVDKRAILDKAVQGGATC